MRRDDNLFALDPGLELVPVLNRHDPRNNRDGDASGAHASHPVEKDVGIVEHLRKDEFGASVHLVLQPRHLLLPTFRRVGRLKVALRESGNGDAKVARVVFVNVSNEIDGVHESARGRLPR